LNYTLSRKTSDADGIFSLPSNSYDLAADRSTSDDDNRHRFYGFFNWKVMKSINFSANAFITSPNPYSITTGFDNNGDTIFNDRPIGVARNSERGAWSINLGNTLSWTYAFGKADSPKNPGGGMVIITSGGAPPVSVDKKKYSLQFFVSAQNVINRVNHIGFVGVQTSPFFRQPVSASSPRRISFGVRFSF
ncbi:MAG: hypothetical protein KDB79_15890, partial [Acidobacteria bacterium]|nr:hypothetical protein [Acidobacteriota bacterium]